ncbi:stage II sporulation protein M [Cohnella silvisoli]|uniref:Stage II sporulation protein M n=1 Tax=Cohnella silvisoli TaxID=2873699 RepID=A0ABV1L3T0_9BACL|nr:stage II sporulation protein M [Cohnella silvisoli]MCD9026401.1 stage II sporulation protein M [Cohnella silvisoli]
MFSRRGLLQSWNEVRSYFIFSVILFFAGIVIGGSHSAPVEFLESQLKGISQIADAARKSETPELTMFLLIAANNIFKSIMVMGLGIVAGILPIVMLVANGLILGYLLSGIADNGQNVWLLIVKGLLPHGVLELSALFLACAFGIRFGMTLIKGIAGSALGKSNSWQPFVRTATGSVPALIVVTVVLFIAAIVESTITYWLMS